MKNTFFYGYAFGIIMLSWFPLEFATLLDKLIFNMIVLGFVLLLLWGDEIR